MYNLYIWQHIDQKIRSIQYNQLFIPSVFLLFEKKNCRKFKLNNHTYFLHFFSTIYLYNTKLQITVLSIAIIICIIFVHL